MRYAPPGLCLNDFAVLVDAGAAHLLHLQAPPVEPFEAAVLETSVGHAVSADLVRWEPAAPVFGVAAPSRFDDSAIWTMSTAPAPDGGLSMLYTGVRLRRHGSRQVPWQSVGLARSARRDGTGWRRVGREPVLQADPRWYRVDEHQAWRDPFLVPEDGLWWALVAARDAAVADPERGGCVGLASSPDQRVWTVHPPVLSPGRWSELECPVPEPDGRGGWWLLVGIGGEHAVRLWHAPGIRGPFTDHGWLPPAGAYAPRLLSWHGERLLLHTVRRRHGGTDAGPLVRGLVAQPKRWLAGRDGRPRLGWWDGVRPYLQPPTDGPVGDAVALVEYPEPVAAAGMTLRGAGTGPGLAVTVADGVARLRYTDGPVLARAPWPGPVRSLRVLCSGEHHEVYVDDEFLLLAAAPRAAGGGVVRLLDDGSGRLTVRPVRPVYPDRDDLNVPAGG